MSIRSLCRLPASVHAVTFDVGGTLVAPNPSVGAVYSEVLASHGIAADPDRIEDDFRAAFQRHATTLPTSDEVFWKRVFRDACASARMSENLFAPAFAAAYDAFAKGRAWRLLDGAEEVLDFLKARGYRLAVLSNSDSRFRTVLADHGLDTFFEQCFLSGEIGYEKPDSRIFRHAESVLGLAPRQILHIGDSRPADAEGAAAAGWNACLLDPPRTSLRSLLHSNS